MLDQEHDYEDYQESGQSWVGRYPSDWKLVRNKAIFTEKTAAVGKRASEYKLLSLTLGGVIPRDMENPKGKFPAEFDTYKIVEPDDLIFCLFDVAETPRAVGRAEEAGMITGAYTVLRPRPGISPRFLNYFYLSLDYDKRLSPLYTGLRNVIKIDTFMSIKTPLPDLGTQNRIVSFLDEKTAEIDAAIAKKRRLIDLLNEQKAILINRAVTKGFNPDAPMKDSGVDWIGEIPAHWDLKRARFLFRSVTRRDRDGTEVKLSVTQRRGLVPTSEMEENSTQAMSFDEFQLCHPGDMVLNKYKAHLGVFWAATSRGIITNNYTVFRSLSAAVSLYFERLFHTKAYIQTFAATVYGVVEGMSPLYTNDFYDIPCITPPVGEQEKIVVRCRSLDREFSELVDTIEREITALNEFKQTLIANAVTGKIKI